MRAMVSWMAGSRTRLHMPRAIFAISEKTFTSRCAASTSASRLRSGSVPYGSSEKRPRVVQQRRLRVIFISPT